MWVFRQKIIRLCTANAQEIRIGQKSLLTVELHLDEVQGGARSDKEVALTYNMNVEIPVICPPSSQNNWPWSRAAFLKKTSFSYTTRPPRRNEDYCSMSSSPVQFALYWSQISNIHSNILLHKIILSRTNRDERFCQIIDVMSNKKE